MIEEMDFPQVYADIEDHLIPYLRLDASERAVYYQLLRHTRLKGERNVLVSKRGLARTAGLGLCTVFSRLHSLARKGCIQILHRSHAGHQIEVLVPEEIPGCLQGIGSPDAMDLEAASCFRNVELRRAILRREGNCCFYCLRRIKSGTAVLDHVVPLSAGGDNSYRNVVATCFECNSRKSSNPAPDFLRELYRSSALTPAELEARLAALDSLRAGHSKPILDR